MDSEIFFFYIRDSNNKILTIALKPIFSETTVILFLRSYVFFQMRNSRKEGDKFYRNGSFFQFCGVDSFLY